MEQPFRIALANLPFPASPDESVALAVAAIEDAGAHGAGIVCFPECYVPGYRVSGRPVPPPEVAFLERAWATIAEAAERAKVGVALGTERVLNGTLVATVLVIDEHGDRLGFQDKVQIDPSEDGLYTPGVDRQLFKVGALTFGIAICHEGWRYPETVRWPARRGAQIVFHPHFHWAEEGSHRPTTFGEQANTFHEKAALCRAAENTIWFATVNYATDGSPTTSAVACPDGTLLTFQPYGVPGLLIADIDLGLATGLLASRCRSTG